MSHDEPAAATAPSSDRDSFTTAVAPLADDTNRRCYTLTDEHERLFAEARVEQCEPPQRHVILNCRLLCAHNTLYTDLQAHPSIRLHLLVGLSQLFPSRHRARPYATHGASARCTLHGYTAAEMGLARFRLDELPRRLHQRHSLHLPQVQMDGRCCSLC